MGGIVTTASWSSRGELSILNNGSNGQLTLATAPNLTFEEIESILPLCAASWNRLFARKSAATGLGDIFHMHIEEQLRRLNDNGAMLSMLMRSSTTKQSSRTNNPIGFILRYCVKHNARSEKDYTKRLQTLGREHARIGIDAYMLADFCNIVLAALCQCFDASSSSRSVLHAWAANLNFVYKQMTAVQFSFVRKVDVGGKVAPEPVKKYRRCPRCEENHVGIGCDVCAECLLADDFSVSTSTTKLSAVASDVLKVNSQYVFDVNTRDRSSYVRGNSNTTGGLSSAVYDMNGDVQSTFGADLFVKVQRCGPRVVGIR